MLDTIENLLHDRVEEKGIIKIILGYKKELEYFERLSLYLRVNNRGPKCNNNMIYIVTTDQDDIFIFKNKNYKKRQIKMLNILMRNDESDFNKYIKSYLSI